MDSDRDDLTERQREVVEAVEQVTAESSKAQIPLVDVAEHTKVSRGEPFSRLTPSLLDMRLSYREDKHNSPGWLALSP